jgi:hypothetical protein
MFFTTVGKCSLFLNDMEWTLLDILLWWDIVALHLRAWMHEAFSVKSSINSENLITDNWLGLWGTVFVECSILDFVTVLIWFKIKLIYGVKFVFSCNMHVAFLEMNAQFSYCLAIMYNHWQFFFNEITMLLDIIIWRL